MKKQCKSVKEAVQKREQAVQKREEAVQKREQAVQKGEEEMSNNIRVFARCSSFFVNASPFGFLLMKSCPLSVINLTEIWKRFPS